MSITIQIVYRGEGGAAAAFANEMIASGTVEAIRAEDGNEAYAYYVPMDDPEALLLIDRWRDQAALDAHHTSPMMATIIELRDKYDLHMEVRRFVDADGATAADDAAFIRE